MKAKEFVAGATAYTRPTRYSRGKPVRLHTRSDFGGGEITALDLTADGQPIVVAPDRGNWGLSTVTIGGVRYRATRYTPAQLVTAEEHARLIAAREEQRAIELQEANERAALWSARRARDTRRGEQLRAIFRRLVPDSIATPGTSLPSYAHPASNACTLQWCDTEERADQLIAALQALLANPKGA